MLRDIRGVESLPVVLLLGTLLGVCTLSIGVATLERAQRISERQRAIDSFNLLIETSRFISAGGAGATEVVELEMGSCSILVDGKNLRLMQEDTIVRDEILPLQTLSDMGEIRSGSYLVELERVDGNYILRIRGAHIG